MAHGLFLIHHFDSEILRFGQFASGVGSGNNGIGLFGHGSGHFGPNAFEDRSQFGSGVMLQSPREHDRLPIEVVIHVN